MYFLIYLFKYFFISFILWFLQLASCGPAGSCTGWGETEFKLFSKSFEPFSKGSVCETWWNWVQTLFQKFWTLLFEPFSKGSGLWGPFPKACCGPALFQRLAVVQPFSKGFAWLRSFPKPFWRLPFPKLLPFRCQGKPPLPPPGFEACHHACTTWCRWHGPSCHPAGTPCTPLVSHQRWQ